MCRVYSNVVKSLALFHDNVIISHATSLKNKHLLLSKWNCFRFDERHQSVHSNREETFNKVARSH